MKKWLFITGAIIIVLLASLFFYLKYQENMMLKKQTLLGYQWVECVSQCPLVNNTFNCSSKCPNVDAKYMLFMKNYPDRNINSASEIINCLEPYSSDRNGEKAQTCLKNILPTLKQKWLIT